MAHEGYTRRTVEFILSEEQEARLSRIAEMLNAVMPKDDLVRDTQFVLEIMLCGGFYYLLEDRIRSYERWLIPEFEKLNGPAGGETPARPVTAVKP